MTDERSAAGALQDSGSAQGGVDLVLSEIKAEAKADTAVAEVKSGSAQPADGLPLSKPADAAADTKESAAASAPQQTFKAVAAGGEGSKGDSKESKADGPTYNPVWLGSVSLEVHQKTLASAVTERKVDFAVFTEMSRSTDAEVSEPARARACPDVSTSSAINLWLCVQALEKWTATLDPKSLRMFLSEHFLASDASLLACFAARPAC
jgi:hypothetical protein